MKKIVFYLLCILLTAVTIDVQAGTKSKSYKRYGSNVYSSKKYKGHTCPPKRKIINAIYF